MPEERKRPNPEDLLAALHHHNPAHGRLKIFFGYAAGVGKTYAMLTEAHEQLAAGVDLVVGYVEPHTRPETMRLLDGLPQLPPKKIPYRGLELTEFDLDAALERSPQLIVVDELAHTNAEGVRNKKRYQDVEELLRAGIDVYTTVNVQHLESLNNFISEVTRAPVRETVPDQLFDHADRVKIIDIEPDELLRRLAEGKVYHPDRVAVATANFFTPENLSILRETAIREVANRISHGNQAERHLSEKMANAELLCYIGVSPLTAKCLRWTARMAEALFVPWVAVYVEEREQELLPLAQRRAKRANIDLAEKLGAEVVTLSGVDVPRVIAEYARLAGITNIVLGKRPHKLWRADFEDRLVELLPGVEIHLISDDAPTTPKRRPARSLRALSLSFSGWDVVKTLLLLVAATVASFGLKSFYGLQLLQIGDQDIIMVYILSVLVVSRVTEGYLYGAVASLVSVLAFNFFFTEPIYTFNAIAPDYPLTFLIMLLIALITSALTVRVKTQARLAVKREQRTEVLYEIGKQLLVTQGVDNIVEMTSKYIVRLFGRSVVFYTDFDTPAHVLRAPGELADFLDSPDERAVAHWVFVNRKQAGEGTDTLAGAGALYLPVVSQDRALGVIGVSCERTRPSTFSRFFLQTIIAQVALALERQALSDEHHRDGASEAATGPIEEPARAAPSSDRDTGVIAAGRRPDRRPPPRRSARQAQ